MMIRILIVPVLIHLSSIVVYAAAPALLPDKCFIGVYDYQLKRGVAVGQATLEENDGQIELVVPRACLPENGGKIYLMRPKDTTNSDDLFPYDIFHSLRIDPMPHAITYWGRLVNGFSGICESDASKLPFVRDSRIERILINPCEAFTFG